MRVLVALLIVALIGALVYMMRRKLTVGGACCGTTDGPVKKKKVRDKNPEHYNHEYTLDIRGMHCANCAATVENALNSLDGVWGRVDLSKKQADVLTKEPKTKEDFLAALAATSYTLTGMEEVA